MTKLAAIRITFASLLALAFFHFWGESLSPTTDWGMAYGPQDFFNDHWPQKLATFTMIAGGYFWVTAKH